MSWQPSFDFKEQMVSMAFDHISNELRIDQLLQVMSNEHRFAGWCFSLTPADTGHFAIFDDTRG